MVVIVPPVSGELKTMEVTVPAPPPPPEVSMVAVEPEILRSPLVTLMPFHKIYIVIRYCLKT